MLQRCTNPRNTRWADYGGRGIKVCERWLDLDNFVSDMGPLPNGMSLDRIDPNGNYEPANCRWATASQQARNTRRKRMVIYQGKQIHLCDLAALVGVPERQLHERIYQFGWSVDKAASREKFKADPVQVSARLRALSAIRKAARTHCPHGHELNFENTYVHNKVRYCRTCKNAWNHYSKTDRAKSWPEFVREHSDAI